MKTKLTTPTIPVQDCEEEAADKAAVAFVATLAESAPTTNEALHPDVERVYSKNSTEVEIGDPRSVAQMPLAPGNPGFTAIRDAALALATQPCMAGIKGFRISFWNEGKSFALAVPPVKGAIRSLPHSDEGSKALRTLKALRGAVAKVTGSNDQTWVFHASPKKRSFGLYSSFGS